MPASKTGRIPVGGNGWHMTRAHLAAALYQGDNGLLWSRLSICAVPSLTAHKSFVSFYHLLSAAQRGSVAISHACPDTVHEKPSCFHAAIEPTFARFPAIWGPRRPLGGIGQL